MNPANGGRMLANGYTPDGYYVDGNGVYRPGVGTAQYGGQDNSQSSGQNSTQLSEAQFEDQVIELVNQERAKAGGFRPVKKGRRAHEYGGCACGGTRSFVLARQTRRLGLLYGVSERIRL